MNEDTWEKEHYPPQNRFMVTFTSKHKLAPRAPWDTTECWTYQSQRRFVLADNANAAREHFRLGELAEPQWKNGFHSWENLQVGAVPNAVCWTLGYNRFHTDIRGKVY